MGLGIKLDGICCLVRVRYPGWSQGILLSQLQDITIYHSCVVYHPWRSLLGPGSRHPLTLSFQIPASSIYSWPPTLSHVSHYTSKSLVSRAWQFQPSMAVLSENILNQSSSKSPVRISTGCQNNKTVWQGRSSNIEHAQLWPSSSN